ncbi:transposase [Candidatus Saccharibacteria bacterium]|nr:transposase [Candidatus Saccharibacteria bacterium]
MSNRIGSSTIYTSILPTGNKLHSVKLSKEAKHRLRVIDYYLKSHDITQYFARPHTPKDKPRVENLIGKLQQECLDEYRGYVTLPERAQQITKWINDYHFFRPHQALDYLTPAEFCDTLGLTIHRRKVSTM